MTSHVSDESLGVFPQPASVVSSKYLDRWSSHALSLGMASPCELSPSERDQIQRWASAHGTPQQVALRCEIVLAAAEGQSDVAIAEQLSVNRKTVILWRTRFTERRLEGLWEVAPGRGRKPTYDIGKIAAVVNATLQTKPEGMTHWSCRTMAQHQGISKSTISTIWQAHNLKPIAWKHLNCQAIRSSWRK
jgi:hypothetical protein